MSKNSKRTLVVTALVFLVFTAIAFLIPFKKTALFWVSYIFGVIAVGIQIPVLKISFDGAESVRSKFYGFPIAQIGFIYMVAQLILSLLFMALAAFVPVWIASLLFVILLAAGVIGFIGADAMRDEIERQDVKLECDTSCMSTLRSLVYPLATLCDDGDAKKALSELADEFRYSDPVSSGELLSIESELDSEVAKLRELVNGENTQDIPKQCRKISAVLAERNRLCRLNKKK